MTTPAPFDACGPLPSGITLLEASAGTGKTFTIAALTARYVAEGTPLERMLLVTFGRMATGELRARVRERLVTVDEGLLAASHGVPPSGRDDVLTLLAAVSPDELATRRQRVATALADFDAATIATTHGFCQQVLDGIGVAGDVDRDSTFVEDVVDIVNEVVDDLYVRRFIDAEPPAGLSLRVARDIARSVVAQPSATIVPTGATDPLAAMRVRLAHAVRTDVERRKRQLRVLTYDDLLIRLERALRDPQAAARLRRQFDVVMIDEFQDTDPVQWEILRTAFGDGSTTLILIGDPKQAIYAFRGADVHTYLEAARRAETVATLARNWRSDQGLVEAYDAMFDGLTLGHPGIEYRTVQAADAHQRPRLRGAPHGAALRLRVAHRDDGRIELTRQGWAGAPSGRTEVAHDLAADVVSLLSAGAERITRGPDGAELGVDRVGPGDIGVLVATHRHGALVRDALESVGVPAVIAGAGSVFGTPVAREWLTLLEALERPSAVSRVHATALTSFIGWSVEHVATADDAAWESVYIRLHDWATVLRTRGVASLLETVTRHEHLPARVLSREDGERNLTDLLHMGQLLHHEVTTERLGVSALAAWLRARIREAADDVHDEDRSRRLESDSAAVQVLTIHRCKGLEFPIVYCPFLWQPPWLPTEPLPLFHDTTAGGRRSIDVGGRTGSGHVARFEQHVAEVQGEALRLAYVALTRARHQTVLHWASSWESRESPLARLLFASELDADAVALPRAPDEAKVIARLEEIAARAPGTVSIERTTGPSATRWAPPATPSARLAVRAFGRDFDASWHRASYSSLTSTAKEQAVTSEAETPGTTDEELDLAGVSAEAARNGDRARLAAVALPLAAMAGGTRIGTMVHSVLEHTDYAAPDLRSELIRALADQTAGSTSTPGATEILVEGLTLAIETPLGPLASDLRLRDITRADRLDELTFELPIAGGDDPAGQLRVTALADLFERHLPSHDALAGYASRLREPLLDQRVRGYLTGSIDTVLRVRGTVPRFVVVDYKTNWLAVPGGEISAWDYRPAALATAMEHGHYPLQALFYLVALHRYLRWRLTGYDPDVHLAGALYLFLRGMVGADTPRVDGTPCGVFSWRPPASLVVATSDLLDRGSHDG